MAAAENTVAGATTMASRKAADASESCEKRRSPAQSCRWWRVGMASTRVSSTLGASSFCEVRTDAPSTSLRLPPSVGTGLPRLPHHPSSVPCPLPRRIERVRSSIASPLVQPSPNLRRVGIRIITFEACSDFTLVTAHWIAQPPRAAFVTRLRPGRLPGKAARQLPDLSTTIWVEPPSTGVTRRRGALKKPG